MGEGEKLQLGRMLAEHSVREGTFTLSSGQKSDFYVDCKKTVLLASAAPLIGRVFLDAIEAEGALAVAVGGQTMGADPLAFFTCAASAGTDRPLNAFSVRKQPKEHGTQAWIEGPVEAGDPVVVVEDVVTSGKSAIHAIERCQTAGLLVKLVVTLVDREEGGMHQVRDRAGCPAIALYSRSNLMALRKGM